MLVQTRQLRPENFGKWCLPGGKIDEGDGSLVATLRRELHEELGVWAHIHRQIDQWEEMRDDGLRLHHIFHVTLPAFEVIPDPVEILGVRWFCADEILPLSTKTGYEKRAIAQVMPLPGQLIRAGA